MNVDALDSLSRKGGRCQESGQQERAQHDCADKGKVKRVTRVGDGRRRGEEAAGRAVFGSSCESPRKRVLER